jgi:hypothetical protein
MIAPRRTLVGIVLLLALGVHAQAPPILPVPQEEQLVREALAAEKKDEALAAMQGAVAARERQASIDAGAAADALDDLGIALYQGAGGSEEAVAAANAALQRALAVRKRAFGERGAVTAKSYSTISTLSYLRGRWDEAEANERIALEIRREALPAGDPAIAESLDGLGVILVLQGRLADAGRCWRRPCASLRRTSASRR